MRMSSPRMSSPRICGFEMTGDTIVNVSEAIEDKLTHLHFLPDPSEAIREEITMLEKRLIRCYVPASDDEIARARQHGAGKTLQQVAEEIRRLDEAEFYRSHAADATFFSDDHFAGDEMVDWSSGRRDFDASRLASEASYPIIHAHICRVTGIDPAVLHVQGGFVTLDNGQVVTECRLPPWADPLGRRRDYERVASEIEAVTPADFQQWLGHFEDVIVLGWEGRRLDCVMHRFLRQLTGIRWDCLRIDGETATVESPIFTRSTVARLPDFAAYISTITTYPSVPDLRLSMPITAGWLRSVLPGK